jgi:membrane protease YdiL (CAAX protease family)
MTFVLQYLFMLLAWLAIAVPTSAVCVLLWLTLIAERRRLLPPRRTPAAPWSGAEVAFLFLLSWTLPVGIYGAMTGFLGEAATEQHFRQYLATVLACPLFLVAGLVFLHLVSRTEPYQLGIHGRRWRQGIIIGWVAWLAASPLIHGVNVLVGWLVQQVGPMPEPHTLTRVIEGDRPALGWALLLVSALLVAPLLEEFLFRGVILRWSARSSWRGHILAALAVVLTLLNTYQKYFWEGIAFSFVVLTAYYLIPLLVPRRPDRRSDAAPPDAENALPQMPLSSDERIANGVGDGRPPGMTALEDGERGFRSVEISPELAMLRRIDDVLSFFRKDRRANDTRAIYASAFLFAGAHPWPTPVALFLLGLLLGWLALRTRSLVAPAFVHFLFNGISVLMLALDPWVKTAATQ